VAASGRPPRIAIWGHYHGGNQGDDVVVRALRDEFRRRFPDAQLLGISLSPADTRERHGIEALPLRRSSERAAAARPAAAAGGPARPPGPLRAALRRLRRLLLDVAEEPGFLWRCYRRLRGVDLVVVAGSGPLSDDWQGPWSHPYTIFKWSLLARLAGARFAFASVGAGPIDHALTGVFLRPALRWACYRSYRDRSSAEIAGRLGRFEPERVFPDLAFSLALEPAPGSAPRGRAPVVGLNAIPYYDSRYWPDKDAARYRRYLDETAAFTASLLRRSARVVVVYSQLSADPRVADDLRELLRGQGLELDDPETRAPITSQEEMLQRISLCDFLVSGRFHCILLPYLLGKPVVGLAYHAKTFELMRSMGQADYCLDIEHFDARALEECFGRLEAHADEIRAQLALRVAEQRRALARLYDELLTAGVGRARATPST
jgi:polysaccharide pyruvyl transferase WcaK-like protein